MKKISTSSLALIETFIALSVFLQEFIKNSFRALKLKACLRVMLPIVCGEFFLHLTFLL